MHHAPTRKTRHWPTHAGRIAGLLLVLAAACGSAVSTPRSESKPTRDRCTGPSSTTIIKRVNNATLELWELEYAPVHATQALPADRDFHAYRTAIVDADAARRRPVADQPVANTPALKRLWARERHNAQMAFSGKAGRVRPIQCLEALFFAAQNRRHSQLDHPTEFIASVLRKSVRGRVLLRAYVAGGDQMFPPKLLYGFDEAAADVASGWTYWFVLHNHTIQKFRGNLALGTPTLSTADADLHRGLAKRLGLHSARITNGFFTAEIPARAFGHYLGRGE